MNRKNTTIYDNVDMNGNMSTSMNINTYVSIDVKNEHEH